MAQDRRGGVAPALESAAWFADGRDTGNFEAIISGTFNYMDDLDLFFERHTTGDSNNWGRFSDRRIDDVFARQTRTLDPSERKRLVNEIEKIMLENRTTSLGSGGRGVSRTGRMSETTSRRRITSRTRN